KRYTVYGLSDSTVYVYKNGSLAEEINYYRGGTFTKNNYSYQNGLRVSTSEINEKGSLEGKRKFIYYPDKNKKQEKYYELVTSATDPSVVDNYEYDSLGRISRNYGTYSWGNEEFSFAYHYNQHNDCDSSFEMY